MESDATAANYNNITRAVAVHRPIIHSHNICMYNIIMYYVHST